MSATSPPREGLGEAFSLLPVGGGGDFGEVLGFAADDASGVLAGQGEVVRGHDDGGAGPADLVEEVDQPAGGVGVEVAGGLVGQDDLGGVEQGAGDDDALLLAAGELVGHLVALGGHTHLAQDVVYLGADGFLVAPAGGAEDELEVVVHGAVDEQAEVIRKQWLTDGYKTPQLDTRAAIFDDQGRILMVKEQRSQKWNVPGGWCDEDQTIMSNVVKEVREEAGMEVYPKRLIAILDRSKYNTVDTLGGCLKAFVLCSCGTESFESNSETSERRFFAEDELPVENLRTNTNSLEQLKMCFACYRAAEWTPIVE